MLADAAGHMAFAVLELDRLEEADAWAGRAAALGASVEAEKEMLWRRVRASVLARRGQHVEAERLAREAAVICDGTEMLNEQGNVYADLGEVLLRAGKPAEAAAALEQAEERYRRKGNVVSARRVGERLTGLRA
jgi:tetratricopeptide (TPR) repeat protein